MSEKQTDIQSLLARAEECVHYWKHVNHPTVKSQTLMQYFCKLVTPQGGVVLDPFLGSGSTGVAAIKNDFKFIGIEQSEKYFGIACKRLAKTPHR